MANFKVAPNYYFASGCNLGAMDIGLLKEFLGFISPAATSGEEILGLLANLPRGMKKKEMQEWRAGLFWDLYPKRMTPLQVVLQEEGNGEGVIAKISYICPCCLRCSLYKQFILLERDGKKGCGGHNGCLSEGGD